VAAGHAGWPYLTAAAAPPLQLNLPTALPAPSDGCFTGTRKVPLALPGLEPTVSVRFRPAGMPTLAQTDHGDT
jgi:hypothetical protein